MPTYEYVCPKCGHEFEQFQSMNDQPLKRCPKCKKLGLKRLIGRGGGIIFKGTGFYQTGLQKDVGPERGRRRLKAIAPAADSKPAASGGETKPAASPEKSKPKNSS